MDWDLVQRELLCTEGDQLRICGVRWDLDQAVVLPVFFITGGADDEEALRSGLGDLPLLWSGALMLMLLLALPVFVEVEVWKMSSKMQEGVRVRTG